MRHMIVEGAKEIYQKALNRGDFKGAAAALDKLGKYTRCDKEDETVRLEVYGEVPYQPIDMKDMPEWLTALMAEQYMGGLYCICVGTYNGEKVYNLLLVSDSHFTGRFYNENGESVNIVDLNQYSVVKCIYYRRDFSL